MIREIKYKDNHQVLKGLTLNFQKADGSVYDTIVFAGENGTGKTTIMETLSQFLVGGSIDPFDFMIYEVPCGQYKIVPFETGQNVGYHYRGLPHADIHDLKNKGQWERVIQSKTQIEQDEKDIRHYGIAYSTASAEFKTKKITATKNNKIDGDSWELEKEDTFTSIKQLLVDLYFSGTSSLYVKAMKQNKLSKKDCNEHRKENAFHRFTNAFDNFFKNIKFSRIENIGTQSGEIEIKFEKNKVETTIDKLSSGEKQIVYRGAYLLKNVGVMKNAIILVDEPEISMHPIWQKRILSYYKNLFKQNKQPVQMFFATHSEKVVESALSDKENALVIVLEDNGGKISARTLSTNHKDFVLPPFSAVEVNYVAFGIPSYDLHMQLFTQLQSEIGEECSVLKCDTYIAEYIEKYSLAKDDYCRKSSFRGRNYKTLPSLIRNSYAHNNKNPKPSEEELKKSIDLLKDICREIRGWKAQTNLSSD